MSVLLDKSKENFRAANILINQHECYAASVHCSYYSSFQLSVHILKDKFKMTEDDIDLEAAFGNTGNDSHKKTIAVMFSKLGQANERIKSVDYRREINELKSKRRQADYTDEVIDDKLSQAAYTQAETINKILATVFSPL